MFGQELSECVDMMDWVGEVPVFQAPICRKDCKKWKEVEFGSEIKGTEIINAELSSVFEKLLDEQEGRCLRWEEIENPTDDMVEITDSSKNYAMCAHSFS